MGARLLLTKHRTSGQQERTREAGVALDATGSAPDALPSRRLVVWFRQGRLSLASLSLSVVESERARETFGESGESGESAGVRRLREAWVAMEGRRGDRSAWR